MNYDQRGNDIILEGPPETWPAQVAEHQRRRTRNWGIVCGFGYGFAAGILAFIILLSITA